MLALLLSPIVRAQYVPIPVTGFNNDVVANGVGTNSILGTTYPTIGMDGAQYTFIDNTYKYVSTNALPTCFMPVSGTAASLQTAGMTYQFQSYTANNAMTIDNNSTTYTTSPFANTGTLTLVTPASYGKLLVLYESVLNVSPMLVDVTVTFTDASTQSFPGNNCVNWFTTTLPAYSGMGRTTPTGGIQCGTTPNMFELQLQISPANYSKQVESITFTLPASYTTGTTPATVNYFHAMAVGGIAPCITPFDQPTSFVLTPTSISQISGTFTAAASNPSGYLVVRYPAGSTPTSPVDGTNYSAGGALGTGTVVYVGALTSFNSTGLLGSTSYDFYVYSYNNTACASIVYNIVNPASGTQSTNACGTLSGTIPVGPTAPASPAGFPTVTAAISYINTNGLGGHTILELQNDYTSAYAAANETYPLTFNNNACINSTRTLTVRPASGVTAPIVLTSALNTATVLIDGGDYITMDGRRGGVGTDKYLKVVNTSATAAAAGNAVILKNDANNNTLTYLDLAASNLNPASNAGTVTNGAIPGVVAIGSTSGLTGNDNNSISYCDIHAAGTTGNLLAVGIYAYNATTVGNASNNDNNTIDHCNVYDVFHASAADAALDILAGNNNWTITNNSVYQTGSRTYATTAATHRGFWITPGSSALGSSGFTISGNSIGGTAPLCGGSAYTMLGSIATVWLGMDISVGTLSTSNVENNTVQNIALTTTSSGNPYFAGISVASGNVNVGNGAGTGNTIGSGTGNGSITITNSTTSSTTSNAYGIRFGGGAIVAANYNTVGSITVNNGAISNSVVGIATTGGGTTSATITNNLVGSLTTANSIQTTGVGASATAMGMCGIYISSGPVLSTISNNTVANLFSSYTGTSATTAFGLRGIDVVVGANTINGNTIRNLSSNATGTGSGNSSAICGIVMRSTTAPTTISGNTIHSLKLSGASTTAAVQITGLFVSCAASGANVVHRNNLHSLWLTAANNAATITGITVSAGAANYYNNMIRLGYDDLGNSVTQGIQFRGITKGIAAANNFYHNSIYIGGSNVASSTLNSFAFQRSTAPTAAPNDEVMNNIFVNNRSNASTGGKHYAFSASANTFITANYNVYYIGGTGGVFGLNSATDVPVYTPGWLGSDLNSLTGDPAFLNPNGDAATGDLHISSVIQTPVEQGGTFISSVLEDYDAQTRSALSPVDIGADAGNFTLLNPCNGVPAASTATLTNTASLCGSGTKTIYLAGFTGQPGNTYKWQQSPTGAPGSFIDVIGGLGANTASYTTATLTSPMFYQCVVYCSITGDSTVSSTVQAVVNPAPSLVVTPASGINVCSGSNVDLEASGALTYTWSCNPGVTGYPQVSLFSTPNNTAKVTSRPTSTLASSTATPPATVATPTWTYTVTGTDAIGCTSTASVVLNVITSALVPLQLTYTASPANVCAPGIPVTFTVNHSGTIGSGQWIYNWYDNAGTTLLQTTTNTASSDNYTPATPASIGNKSYLVKVSNTVCPSSYAVASPSIFVGYTSLNVTTNANCGDNGIVVVYPEGNTDLTPWYVNNFTTGLLGAAFDASYGNANFTGGRCNITPQANSMNGTLLIRNPANINTNNLRVDFKMSTGPRGFGFNILGADGMAWSYAPDVYQGALTPANGGFNAESGSGTGFKLAFDATANGAGNTPGAYLMYNCTTPDQGPTSPGVLAFKQGSFWQGLVDAPVSINITDNGYVTVSVNNEVIFDHVPLPSAYLTANKSNWLHAFTARTGGSNELHAIDDLSIQYGTYEYSNNSTNGLDGSWQTSNVFSSLAPGSYPIWVRNANDPSCFSNTGTAVIGVSPSPSTAVTVPASGYSNVVCYNSSTTLTTDVYVPGANFLWESASNLAGPWSPAAGTNGYGDYTTPGLIENTYYRLNFTCPSASTITSAPLLVTVNAGTIASTNSPQLLNCTGDVATLVAVPGANTTCVWYNSASGGSALANGNTYTVTPTSLPATYYVEPVTTIYSNHYYNGGQTVIANTFGTASTGVGISTRFNTTASVIIDSIKVLPSAAGTLTVALQASGSATNMASVNFTVTAAMVGSFVNVPVNLTVPGSGNYQLTTTGVACTYYSSYSGSYTVPYMSLGGVFSITSSATTATGANSTVVYGTAFRWAISSSCPAGSGARIPVVVNANPAYDISISAPTAAFCVGTIQTLTATSANAYSNYSWTPVTDLYTDAGATVPYTAGTNAATVYLKASSGGTKTYTVSTAGSGCTNTKDVTLSVTALPSVTVSATPASICQNGNVQLNASTIGAYCTAAYTTGTSLSDYITNVTLGSINNTTGASSAPYNTYYNTLSTSLSAGSSYTVTGTLNNGGTEDVAIWIDYNQDGTFSAAEKLGEQQTLSFSIPFTVPLSAYNGTTRMRVRNVYATTNIQPCTSYTYGEVEDYNVVISGGVNPAGFVFDWSANSTYLSSTTVANPVASAMLATQTYSVQVTDLATGCTNSASQTVVVNMPSASSTTVSLPCGSSYTWNGNTYTSSGTYSATTVNAVGCDSVVSLNLTIAPCNITLNLTCFIEGYWDGISQMVPALFNQGEPTTTGVSDSIDVELHSDTFPYGVDASVRTVLNQNGTAVCVFPPMSGNKYIVVKHRSALQTWSANPVALGSVFSYDFSTASTQAYGSNMVQVSASPVIWAFYSGDVVSDENMDLLDLGAVETDISNFGFGYMSTDLNGDGNVDLLDSPTLEINISNFVYSNHP